MLINSILITYPKSSEIVFTFTSIIFKYHNPASGPASCCAVLARQLTVLLQVAAPRLPPAAGVAAR